MSKVTNWKNNEKALTELANYFKIRAERINRSGNYAVSTYDCDFLNIPEMKPDAKYSIKGFKTSRMLNEVQSKYCKKEGDIPLLFCRGYRESKWDAKITLPAPYALALISYWNGLSTKLELEELLKDAK